MSRKAYIDTQLNPADIQKVSVSLPNEDEKLVKQIEDHIVD